MTLILSLANRDNIIQLSDRRLSAQGIVLDDEAGKAGILFCKNGRFAFGFTGIARVARLEVRRWILDALYESGPPDYLLGNILDRFKNKATNFFKKNQNLQNLSLQNRQLTIMFTGYLYTHKPSMIGCAMVSNFLDPSKDISTSNSWEEFIVSATQEKTPRIDNQSFVQRIGAWPAMTNKDEISLRSMLENKKPANAIINKSIKLLLQMADRSGSRGTIGKQITWIRIPSNNSKPAESGYYSNIPTHTVFMPSVVVITSDKDHYCCDSPQLSADDPITTPPKN